MAILTPAQMVTLAREIVQDTDTTDPGVTSAVYYDLINEAYYDWKAATEPRTINLSARQTGWIFISGDGEILGIPQNLSQVLRVSRVANIATDVGVPLERITEHRFHQLMGASSLTSTPTRYFLQKIQSQTATEQGKWRLRVYPPANGTFYFAAAAAVAPPALADSFTVAGCTAALDAPPAGAAARVVVTTTNNFNAVEAGMTASGSNVPAGAFVLAKTSSTTLIISDAASSGASVTYTFATAFDGSEAESRMIARVGAARAAVLLGNDEAFVNAIWSAVPQEAQRILRHELRAERRPRFSPQEQAT